MARTTYAAKVRCVSSTSFPALAVSPSDLSEPGCEPSPSVKSTPSAAECSASTGPESQPTMTCASSEGTTLDQLTLFAGDTLASPSASPGSEQARRMTATSGLSIAVLSKSSGPLGSLEKMLLGTSVWGSTVCCLTWTPSGTPAGRLLFRLVPSMQDTDEIESGLWPTATQDSASNRSTRYKQGGLPLAMAVKLWPTPSANEDAAGTPNGKMQKMLGNHPEIRASGPGTLNPTWVEWLMGFPLGWTVLERSAMPSSRKSRSASAGQS
jgi:hypothetical protein